MISVRLDPEIENRLERLAMKSGRSKTSLTREAILEHLEDLEDVHLAEQRLKKPDTTYSAEEVRRVIYSVELR